MRLLFVSMPGEAHDIVVAGRAVRYKIYSQPARKAKIKYCVHGAEVDTTVEDEVDAAARVLHPVFDGVATGEPLFGVFMKDYAETEW